jgi:hypothetical protein
MLLSWNGGIDNEAYEATFYSFWTNRFLKPTVLAVVGGMNSRTVSIEVSMESVIDKLRKMDKTTRGDVLKDTLDQADRSFVGDSFAARRALFRHAIQDDVAPGVCFSAGPNVWAGDDTTVRFGKSGRDPNVIEFGASFRIVVDVADWDNSRWSNVPDQTAFNGGNAVAVPLLYSPKRIKSEAGSVTVVTVQD